MNQIYFDTLYTNRFEDLWGEHSFFVNSQTLGNPGASNLTQAGVIGPSDQVQSIQAVRYAFWMQDPEKGTVREIFDAFRQSVTFTLHNAPAQKRLQIPAHSMFPCGLYEGRLHRDTCGEYRGFGTARVDPLHPRELGDMWASTVAQWSPGNQEEPVCTFTPHQMMRLFATIARMDEARTPHPEEAPENPERWHKLSGAYIIPAGFTLLRNSSIRLDFVWDGLSYIRNELGRSSSREVWFRVEVDTAHGVDPLLLYPWWPDGQTAPQEIIKGYLLWLLKRPLEPLVPRQFSSERYYDFFYAMRDGLDEENTELLRRFGNDIRRSNALRERAFAERDPVNG